jgi:plastocyanin
MPVLVFISLIAALTMDVRNADAADQTPNQVVIDNFTFAPQTVTVRPGTQVTWTNRDDIPHNVVSSDNKFKSKALDTNDQFSFTFNEAGTYEYFCGLHPRMTGKIIVQQ